MTLYYFAGRMKNNRTTARITFSVEPILLCEAKVAARDSGHEHSFSAYLSQLLRRDIECRRKNDIQPLRQ